MAKLTLQDFLIILTDDAVHKKFDSTFEPIIKLTVDGAISKFEKKGEMEVNTLIVKILAMQGDCAAKDIQIQALKSKNTTLETKIGDMAQKMKI